MFIMYHVHYYGIGLERIDMDTAENNIALVRAAYERVIQDQDVDASLEFLAEDFIANIPGLDEPLHGRDIWRIGLETMLAAFPDLRIDIENIFCVGDEVAVRLRFAGTHRGTFQGVEPTNRSVSFRSLEHYRVMDGRIVEEWVAPDVPGLMRQIGAV